MVRMFRTNTPTVGTQNLHIKYLFYSAHKAFKAKGWKSGEPGVGIAIDKLEKYRSTSSQPVAIRLCNEPKSYVVDPTKLLGVVKKKGCFNNNGNHLCGYVTKSDIYRLARGSKTAVDSIEDTSTARN
jgi:hypothetical protein